MNDERAPRVLILTARTGGGHKSLAAALRDQLAPYAEATIVDPIPASMAAGYRFMSRSALWLWAAGYALTDSRPAALALHRVLARNFAPALDALLAEQRPDAVVSTYQFLTYEVRRALDRQPSRIPFAMLFADPEFVHQVWLTERGADVTLVPTRETHAQALAAGFDPERLHLSGWPVRAGFARRDLPPREETLRSLGFDPERLTIFAQGGGEGSGGFARSVAAAIAAGAPQILLAAGTNEALARRFAGAPGVRVLPFTDTIAPLMAAADVVLGKAGPNTLIEAVTLGRPFVATTFIPGQERGNLDFIRRHDLGWVALEEREQRALVERLLAEPARLAEMRASVGRYAAWNTEATSSIAEVVMQMVAGAVPQR